MTHLHGGFVAADSDGNPAITPDGFGLNRTQTVRYTNQSPQMPATLLWFHDHGLGATRLNVFAGLAGDIIRDQYDIGTEPNPVGIPGGAYEVPLVIQDRQFNADGTMLYPRSDISGVTWIGEYFGDVMLVNGKVWPFWTSSRGCTGSGSSTAATPGSSTSAWAGCRCGRSAPKAACGTSRYA